MPTALATYAFLNAKLKARTSKFLAQGRIEDLVRAKSLSESFLLLRGTGYERLEAAFAETGDLRACEARLYAADSRVFLELTRWASGTVARFFAALSLRSEIDTLKGIMRLWFDAVLRGGGVTGTAAYADRGPLVHAFDVDALLYAEDAAAFLSLLAGTPYAAVLGEALAKAAAGGTLFDAELALDRFYFDEAYAAAARLPAKDRAIAERALNMDADAQNADRLSRFRAFYGFEDADLTPFLIPHGEAAKARGRAPNPSAGDGKAKVELLRKAFQAMATAEARRLLGGFPFSVGIPLAYATLKRDETRAVLAILNGKNYGLDEERIRDAL